MATSFAVSFHSCPLSCAVCVLISCKDSSRKGFGPTLTAPFTLINSLKAYLHIQLYPKVLEVGVSTYQLGETQFILLHTSYVLIALNHDSACIHLYWLLSDCLSVPNLPVRLELGTPPFSALSSDCYWGSANRGRSREMTRLDQGGGIQAPLPNFRVNDPRFCSVFPGS